LPPAELGSSPTHERGLPTLCSPNCSAFVGDDLEQPWPERAPDLKPVDSPKGFDERKLGDLLSIVWPRHERGDSPGHSVVSPYEEGVGVGIAGLRAANQRDVVG
jgi:hypothetical protein